MCPTLSVFDVLPQGGLALVLSNLSTGRDRRWPRVAAQAAPPSRGSLVGLPRLAAVRLTLLVGWLLRICRPIRIVSVRPLAILLTKSRAGSGSAWFQPPPTRSSRGVGVVSTTSDLVFEGVRALPTTSDPVFEGGSAWFQPPPTRSSRGGRRGSNHLRPVFEGGSAWFQPPPTRSSRGVGVVQCAPGQLTERIRVVHPLWSVTAAW
jgi:hypothetical protein